MVKWAVPQQNVYFPSKHLLKKIAAVSDTFRATMTDESDSGSILT